MKFKMILYSRTGHTRRVGEEVAWHLFDSGHKVDVVNLESTVPLIMGAEHMAESEIAAIAGYDGLIIASPVHGGKMSEPIRKYIGSVKSFDGKPIVLLATHFLRNAWGAHQALLEMQNQCVSQEGTVLGSIEVRWFNLHRRRDIQKAVEKSTHWLENQQI